MQSVEENFDIKKINFYQNSLIPIWNSLDKHPCLHVYILSLHVLNMVQLMSYNDLLS